MTQHIPAAGASGIGSGGGGAPLPGLPGEAFPFFPAGL